MIDEFLTYLKNELNLADNTITAYRTDLLGWQRFATGNGSKEFDPESYTVAHLRAWIAEESRHGASPRTLRRKAQSLRAFYRYLMRCHGIKANPAAELTLAKTPKPLPVFVRPEETASMLDADFNPDDFEEVRNCLILNMFYSTGMRCSELLTLLDCNVDTARGELKVLGKRNKERIIPFGEELGSLIETYRSLRRGLAGIGVPQLFVRPDGRPLYRKLIYNVVHSAMSGTVHASRMSPHVLRHSFATDMLNSGASLNSVQQLLGHQSLATTQIYTHITYRELQHNYQLAHPRAQKKGK